MVSSIGLAASGFGGLGATLSGGYIRIFLGCGRTEENKTCPEIHPTLLQ